MLRRKKEPPVWNRDELVAKLNQARCFKEPIVEEFLDRTEENLFVKWKGLPAADVQAQQEVFLQAQALAAFRKFIDDTITLGQMAEAELSAKYDKEVAANR